MIKSIIPWRAILLILIGAGLITLYFGQYVGRLTTLSPELSRATQSIATQIANGLPDEDVAPPLVVLPFKGDYTRTLRDQLQITIAEQGRYPVVNPGWLGEQLKKFGFDVPVIGDAESAEDWGGYLGAKRILWGKINILKHHNDETRVNVTATLYDDNGDILWSRTFPYVEQSAIQEQNESSEQAQQWGMIMIWILGTFALPFLMWPVTVTMIRRERNAAGLLLLIVFALISTLLAYTLGYWVDFWSTPGQIALWLVPVAFVSLWIYFVICNKVAEYI